MRLPLCVLLVWSSILSAQKSYVSAGPTLQYGQDSRPSDRVGVSPSVPYLFREHFLDLTAGYGALTVWSNLEFSSPVQIGSDLLGLRKFRISWQGGKPVFQIKIVIVSPPAGGRAMTGLGESTSHPPR